ncbi:MAG TPA: TraM recognition domain-containing protein [Mucilaginibacter sp.]|nr:TraM recognition domain-containing protein [Mucilaginibacter sp.]
MNLFDLDAPIIQFASDGESDAWTLRHAVEGVQIFGGIGSGKTSGSGRMLALKYLSNDFGGLVLTVKPDEKEVWQEYCRVTGREKDLIVIEPGGKYNFNFLEYETNHHGRESLTDNLVDLLKTVIRAGEQKDSGKSDDAFWETALDILIFNVIDLCKLAYGKVSAQSMYDIVQTIPKADEKLNGKEIKPFQQAFEEAVKNIKQQLDNWFDILDESEKERLKKDVVAYEMTVSEAVPDERLLHFLDQFFFDSFKNLSEKTRSIIDFIFTGFLFRLLREPVYTLFCKNSSNVKPEDCMDGKIILINLPVKLYHKVGRDCQILFKYIWQQAMEKRDIRKNPRPVFLFADEAQHFLHEHDAIYQATARSSGISTVYITQNLPNYYAAMGGAKSDHRVKSFLGTLGTKIFHANADIETNKYASELIGDTDKTNPSFQVTVGNESFSQSKTISLINERRVKPEQFVKLKTGGPFNNYIVEGYLHRQGDALFQGQNHTRTTFNQKRR